MWIHLGLKSTDLGIFIKVFADKYPIIGVKLQKHLIKGLGPHLEFLIKAFWRRGAAVSFEISLMRRIMVSMGRVTAREIINAANRAMRPLPGNQKIGFRVLFRFSKAVLWERPLRR
ncbi:MAG: hypothetical protein ACLTER_22570 [Ruminococcus sp.]